MAPEGWPFLGGTLVLQLLAWWAGWGLIAILLFILLLFMINFFRDPERRIPEGEGLFVCPADGKVIRAEATEEGIFVDIFMNIFDVHVNRSPVSGRITHMAYTPGRFVNASFDQASTENERNRWEIHSDAQQNIAITQIAGLVARRIVAYVGVGEHVSAGQRIGMIRFGSRVNCEIPGSFQLMVREGDRVRAGETILARIKETTD